MCNDPVFFFTTGSILIILFFEKISFINYCYEGFYTTKKEVLLNLIPLFWITKRIIIELNHLSKEFSKLK